MKTAIIYYSYSGKTKKYCENMAAELSADILEVQTVKRKCFIKSLIMPYTTTVTYDILPFDLFQL